MKKALLTIVAIAAAANLLNAGTYTWTGAANDGLWFTAGNWNYDDGSGNVTSPAAAPKNTCSDDIIVDGPYAVAYEPGGDLKIAGTLTLINGASFCQTTGTAYCDVKGGTIYVASGGSFDTGTMTGSNGVGLSNVIVDDGGVVYCRRDLKRSKFEVRSGGRLELSVDSYKFPATDDIQSGGLLLVSGNISPQADMTITSAGTIQTTAGQFKPATGSEFGNANVICTHASLSGVVSLLSGSVTFTDDTEGGITQAGSTTLYCNFPAGSTCRVTMPGTAATIYSKTFGTSTTKPKYRYDGSPITDEQFMTLFVVEENDGNVTFYPAPVSENAPEVASGSVSIGANDDSVLVDAAFSKVGTPAAQVYLVYGTLDMGRKLSDWGENKILIGTASELGLSGVGVSGLPTRQTLKFRVFAVNEEGSSASDPLTLYMRKYPVEGTVNEWIGTSGSWTDGANWSLGHQPTETEIPWIENPDAVVTKSSYTLNDVDHMVSGTLAVSGEIHSDVDYTLNGFNFSCTTFVPGSHKFTIQNGSFTAYRTGSPEQAKAGVYGANARVDILSGGTAEMCFYSTGTVYEDTFGGSRFTFNGLAINETEFAKRFTYEKIDGMAEVVRGDDTYYAYRLSLKPSEGEPKVSAYGASFSDDAITFYLQQTEDSIADTVVTVYYGTTDCGATTEGWTASATMSKDALGCNTVTVDVTPGSRFYYAIAAASATAEMTVWRVGEIVAADLPTGRKVWFGISSDASDPANWQDGTLPGPQDVVEISDLFAKTKRVDWNVAAIPSVAGWVQSSGIVYFDTTREQALTVVGDVTLTGSANWTHLGPAESPTNCINVVVGGDMSVGVGTYVQGGVQIINNADYRARGYYNGPGYQATVNEVFDEVGQTNIATTVYLGGSYAGDGGHQPFAGTFVSYGSILNPMEWGSAGKGDSKESYSGAGLVKLVVAGALTVDGSIESHGFGYGSQPAGASGGTVNITAATLAGSGSINADGGLSNRGPGSGGRVSVTLTDPAASFEAFDAPAKIHANPGVGENYTGDFLSKDVVVGAAGTVALKTSADAAARVVVSDSLPADARRVANEPTSIVSATHLPARLNPTENLKATRWELLGYGKLRLTADVRIASLSLATDDGTQKVYTDGHTLTTKSLFVNGTRIPSGVYDAAGTSWIEGSGSVVVSSGGMTIVVR